MVRRLGYLAAWNGLYAGAAAAACSQVLGLRPPAIFYLWVWLTAWSAFLLDRVKLRDAWIEVGDRIALPERTAFLERNAGTVRGLMAVIGAASLAVGVAVHPVAAAMSVAAWLGVFLYSWPFGGGGAGATPSRGVRVKDVFLVKNAVVGVAFALLAVAAAVAEAWHLGRLGEHADAAAVAAVAAWLMLVVSADAAACDIGDTEGDRAVGTRTLAVRFGRRCAWTAVIAAQALASVVLVAAASGGVVRPGVSVWLWSAGPLAGAVAAALAAPRRPRDAIDGRLPAVALVVWAARAIFGAGA